MIAIDNGEYQLNLGADWEQFESDEPDKTLAASKSKRTSIVVSAIATNLPRDRLLEVATKMANVRRDAEQRGRPDQNVTIGENWVELKEGGEIAHIAYAGYDDATIFRFMGWVTQRKLLNLWVSTETRDNDFSKGVFDEVFAGFRFYIP